VIDFDVVCVMFDGCEASMPRATNSVQSTALL
jgi:hypothetical protein